MFPKKSCHSAHCELFFSKTAHCELVATGQPSLGPMISGLTAWPGPEQAGLVFWPMLLRSKVKPTNHNQNYVICLGVQFFASYIQLCCMFCISLKTSKLVSWCLTQFAFSPFNDGSLGVCL